MIRVMIADDHELIRVGIKKILRSCKDIRVVGEAFDVEQTLGLLAVDRPDLLVLDLNLPGSEGVAGLEKVRQAYPEVPILILSMHPEEQFALAALRSGAAGYITKSMAAEELVLAIRRILESGSYVGARLAELLARDVRQAPAVPAREALTNREREVVVLIGAGLPTKKVAAELGISVSSVNTYRARIFRKMGLRSNAALIRYAVQQGLVR